MIAKLKSLIAIGQSSQAINLIADTLSKTDKESYNQLILLSGRISKNQGLLNQGLISVEDYRNSNIKTNAALLSILDSIDPQDLIQIEEKEKEDKVEAAHKTKLLFLAAQPSDKPALKLEKEYLEIRKIFKKYRHQYDITEEFDVTIDTFFESIRDQHPHIIHFSGYGDCDNIVFSRKVDRKTHLIPYEYLAAAFKLIGNNTECVFINTQGSCLFAKVISRFIPCAIGIKGVVTDEDAISFASGFYAALAIEKDYSKAFNFGQQLLQPEDHSSPAHPAIHNMNPRDGGEQQKSFTQNKKEINCQYFLYVNGHSAEDTDTAEDFYSPTKKTTCN